LRTPPISDFNASPLDICYGKTVKFSNTSYRNLSGISWQWSFPGGNPSSSTSLNPSVTYTSSGTHNVSLTATNAFGSDILTKTDYINVHVVLAEAGQDTVIDFGNVVHLNSCCGLSYTWTPSDYLNDAHISNPVSLPEKSIMYILEVKDLNNCTAKDSVKIGVNRALSVPNLITCNSDGHNDYFGIKDLCSGSRLEIYNQWGNLVYKSDSYKNDWDGGKDKADAIYYFVFTDPCTEKKHHGWIHIVH
jgi:large repetitive protein